MSNKKKSFGLLGEVAEYMADWKLRINWVTSQRVYMENVVYVCVCTVSDHRHKQHCLSFICGFLSGKK